MDLRTVGTRSTTPRCDRCRARYTKIPKAERALWNIITRSGEVVGNLCARCQTPSEVAEAVINEATLDYTGPVVTADGIVRLTARPKIGA